MAAAAAIINNNKCMYCGREVCAGMQGGARISCVSGWSVRGCVVGRLVHIDWHLSEQQLVTAVASGAGGRRVAGARERRGRGGSSSAAQQLGSSVARQ